MVGHGGEGGPGDLLGTEQSGFPALRMASLGDARLIADAKDAAAVRALALKEKHTFKTEMDEVARLSMFPHLAKKVA